MIKVIKKRIFKDKEDNILLIGAIICFSLIFWFQFFAYDMPEMVSRGKEWSDLIINISMSYVAGWIIYLVSAYLPKVEKRNKAKNIVYPFLKRVIICIDIPINNSILYPNEKCRPVPNSSEISIGELGRWLNDEFLNNPIEGIRGCFDVYDFEPKTRLEEFVLSTTLPLEDCLNELKVYYDMLSYDEVKLLTDIEKSRYLTFVGRNFKFNRKVIFDKEMFIELYQLIRELDRVIHGFD